MWRHSSAIATGRGNGSKSASFEIREASRARAPDSPMPGEGRSPNSPARRRTAGVQDAGTNENGECVLSIS
jgi:hypothetical protein